MTSTPIRTFDAAGLAAVRARLAALDVRRLDVEMPTAAVVAPLCTKGGGAAAVLFTKRTETVGTHKGQVSFPGGRMDAGDVDEVACALRELDEELAVRSADVDVLGRFHDVISITQMRVTPVVAFVGDAGDVRRFKPASAEVEAVFALTLDELLASREVRALPRSGRAGPWFTAGPYPVWGLTAFILDDILRDVLGLDIPALPVEPPS